jgi:response regulator RpfG family c-di-GMP phosphodiesterase
MFRNSELLRRPKETSRATPIADSRPVVLLADDNETEVGLLRPVLERHNFRVLSASDGRAALELALQYSVRLVIAALKLPRMDGYQLCQKLRERQSTETVPFMFITAQGEIPDKLMGHQTFASDYVQRPINLDEFENRLSAVLRVQTSPQSKRPIASPEGQRGDPESPPPPDQVVSPDQNHKFSSSELENLLEEFKSSKRELETAPEEPAESLDEIMKEFRLKTGSEKSASDPLRGRKEAKKTRLGVNDGVALAQTGRTSSVGQTGRVKDFRSSQEIVSSAEDQQAASTGGEIAEEAQVLYREATEFLDATVRRVEAGEPIAIDKGMQISRRILNSLKKGNGLLLLATERASNFCLSQHAINVAIVASRIAQTLGHAEDRVAAIGLAGILHDVGSVKLPKDLLYKAATYSAAERAEIERRPLYSAQILSGIPGFEWLSQVVAQVHERENGKGYPKHLEGKAISEEAKVLGIANVFEARIHLRPHRPAMTGYQLLEGLTAEVGTFSDRIIKALIRSFSVYPFNEYVILNTGEIGQVVDINNENTLRPTVKVIFTAEGERIDEPKIINLARNASLFITRAIPTSELPKIG